jgi:hypothetical protein
MSNEFCISIKVSCVYYFVAFITQTNLQYLFLLGIATLRQIHSHRYENTPHATDYYTHCVSNP